MSTREEHPSNLLIFLAWSEERQKRTGSHTFQKDRKALPLQKDPNISRIEKNSDTGKVILSLDLEMDRMVHILLSLKERHASII